MTLLASFVLAETFILGPAPADAAGTQTGGPGFVRAESEKVAEEGRDEARPSQGGEKAAEKGRDEARPSQGGKKAAVVGDGPRTVKITSDRSTYLRKEGVLAFEGNVCVDDVEFQMRAKEVNLFLEGTNELKRVVAIGDVAVTNGFRSGSCAKATYNKALSKVVLYGDAKKGIPARLRDEGKRRSEVEGRKITFWIDTEQVEVEGSTVTVDAGGLDAKGGAKNILGR